MEFFINKNSTLPVLKMELIADGRNDYNRFFTSIQNANIYFTMADVVTGVKRIANKSAGLQQVTPVNCVGEEFYIAYQFTSNETSKPGKYVGTFTIEFLDGSGTLIVPIRETLYINILEGDIKK
jgi:hypothetical protein